MLSSLLHVEKTDSSANSATPAPSLAEVGSATGSDVSSPSLQAEVDSVEVSI